MPAVSRSEYESLLYSLPERYPEVSASTLRLYTNSATTALIRGSVHFNSGLELQPHPELPELVSTFPHHRHDLPDIKHNRQPAPGISFQAPNLPTLIADCVELGKALERAA